MRVIGRSAEMSDFWSNIAASFTNEADVELRLVVPLLHALGYEPDDIAPKYPVTFREGRLGRKPEADFVCFSGPLRNRDASLVVVEVKAPGEALPDGKLQGESYAANLRAPLLLLTNGEELEIWQLKATQESERVFESPVESLTANRGTIEQLLSKTTVVDYCRTFQVKTILDASSDFGRYEKAELKRTARYAAAIDRTVDRVGSAERVETGRLLEECPSGCIVVAPSGYGKTMLSNRLFRQAIEKRWRDAKARLAFDIPITDLEETAVSIVAFMQRRLSAHQPGTSESALVDYLRVTGATILCDGFDKASFRFQRHLTTEMTNLLRDYPLTQIFVFSREAARPNVALPLFKLAPLTDDEKRELERNNLDDGSDHFSSIIGMMSPTLLELCENPLLLQLALDYWKREREFPNQLAPLFQSWLRNVLNTEGTDIVASIRRERALTLIADATFEAPITGERVLALMEEDGVPADVLNEFVACDAARVNGSTIEVQHEALADFLRAKKMVSGHEPELLAKISTLRMPSDSFFPVLLMAQLSSHQLQSALWKRLTEVGPDVYFDALRYRFDVSSELKQLDPVKLSGEYLTELLEGVEQPLQSFFPALRETVIEEITGEPGSDLAVMGNVYASSRELVYKLHARRPSAPSVEVKTPSFPGILRSVNLDLSHYRLDSARLVAVELLKKSVLDAVKSKAFKGGVALAQDRLLGRCRFLANEYDFPLASNMDLGAIEQLLLPHKNGRVSPSAFSHDERFCVQELLDDIAILRAGGVSELDPWWVRLGWDETTDVQLEDVTCRVLHEQYRRVQIIYTEVAKTTFPAIAKEMSFFAPLPVRWQLTVVRRAPPHGGSTIYYTWSPAETWQQAGADVTFGDRAPASFTNVDHLREDVERIRAALVSLGRSDAHLTRFHGFTQLSDFSGRHYTGYFDGATPAIHDVCDLLKRDLEWIFSSMPRHD
ncbi:type I restriction enzyme HsdR N-terminal domain-containing protein [Bradyrhizobium sp. STM 3843]|uniref:type I restriction enzyme HsdR N-terminal domain-containing protein n=1 Tax=Bradyrhizobium sp. STM 3843 TaxID=551947 RepID=UPI001AEC39E6|nr:type I restriction enzyme HsdR N-terminal domain-containing protein [Bradyrhizobium sp. STM 3843]